MKQAFKRGKERKDWEINRNPWLETLRVSNSIGVINERSQYEEYGKHLLAIDITNYTDGFALEYYRICSKTKLYMRSMNAKVRTPTVDGSAQNWRLT